MRATLTVLLGLGLAACASPAGGSVPPTATATETRSVSAQATTSSEPSPRLESAEPSASQSAEATITGQLGGDDIEGGCVFVTAEDGTNYEVTWPEGWSFSPETLELTNPEGEVVAQGGDVVTVHGSVAEDVASICQIGPIFEAVEVEVAD